VWRTNLKVVGVVLGTLALYTLIANKIPQIQSEVPQSLSFGANVTSDQLVAAGDKLFNGAGGCTACHGLGTRAPNLLTDEKGAGTIGARCGKREAGKGCKQYLFESLDNPTAYVVSGYQPIMPRMTAQLSPPQIWSLDPQEWQIRFTSFSSARSSRGSAFRKSGQAPGTSPARSRCSQVASVDVMESK
jgi:mono/diheme cytochrome c family protein